MGEFLSKEKFKTRMRKIKLEIDELRTKIDELKSIIKMEVESSINNHIDEMIKNEIEKSITESYERVDRKLLSGYFDECKNTAELVVKAAVQNGIKWESRTIKMDKTSSGMKIEEMYEDGWHIVYAGKLKEGFDNVIIFERPKKIKPIDIDKAKNKKSKKNKTSKKLKKNIKVNRSPA